MAIVIPSALYILYLTYQPLNNATVTTYLLLYTSTLLIPGQYAHTHFTTEQYQLYVRTYVLFHFRGKRNNHIETYQQSNMCLYTSLSESTTVRQQETFNGFITNSYIFRFEGTLPS